MTSSASLIPLQVDLLGQLEITTLKGDPLSLVCDRETETYFELQPTICMLKLETSFTRRDRVKELRVDSPGIFFLNSTGYAAFRRMGVTFALAER